MELFEPVVEDGDKLPAVVVPVKSSGARTCPDCGGVKSPQADKCRKCSFFTRALRRSAGEPESTMLSAIEPPSRTGVREAGHEMRSDVDRPSPTELRETVHELRSDVDRPSPTVLRETVRDSRSDVEHAFHILMSRPGYAVLPLILSLESHERAIVERAILQDSQRP